jgi:hypothetical protein
MLLRIIVLVLVLVLIIYGLRVIRRSINDFIQKDDDQKLKRDRADRDKGNIVDLTRDKDGVYRPGEKPEDEKDNDKSA